MESELGHNQPASENPIDSEEQGANQVTPRSYECNFCKRGFSNAQALGGHMNIHRKDKAKLKQQQSSNQTQPSLDHSKSCEEPHNKQNWNWNVPHQQEHASSKPIHTKQLPLFAESPATSETHKPQAQTTTAATEDTLLSNQDSLQELDLELRLGPEPHDSSSPETGTRKFF